MNPKAKKLTTGVLAMTAVAIWIPQILTGVVQKAPHEPRPEYEADESFDDEFDEGDEAYFDDDDGYTEHDELDGLGYADDAETAAWTPQPASGSLADQLQHTTERLRAFGGPQRVDLDQLLAGFQARIDTTPEVTEVQPTTPRPATTGSTSLALQLAGDALDQFAREQALTAIIHGQGDALAMLGGRIVRVGDELSPGIHVAEIGPRRMRITGGGNTRVLELAPFRTRPALADDEVPDEATDAQPAPVSDLRYLSGNDVLDTPIATRPVLEDSAADSNSESD